MEHGLVLRARRTLVLACLTACASMQAHAGSDLFTGSASLSNLSFQVVDLAPQSGQTPWIQFGTTDPFGEVVREPGWAYVTGLLSRDAMGLPVSSGGSDAFFEGPLPSQSFLLTASDGSGSVGVGPSGFTSTIRLGANALDQAIVVPDAGHKAIEANNLATFGPPSLSPPGMSFDGVTGQVTLYDTEGPRQIGNFSLSAHTQLVVEADVTAEINQGTDAPFLPWAHPGSGLDLYGASGGMIGLARTTPLHPFADSYASYGEFELALNAIYEWQQDSVVIELNEDPSLMAPTTRRLKVTLTNNGDEAMDGLFFMGLGTTAVLTQSMVPEPGTYMLMGLGLVGIFWRRRGMAR